MKIENLHYYTGTAVPGRSAASVHVAYMSQSLAAEISEVTLIAKLGNAAPETEIADYYGVTTPPQYQLIPFQRRTALLAYLRKIMQLPQPDVAIGRYVYPLLFAACRGVPVVYEVHAPANGYKRWIEHKLLRRQNLCKLVTITHALANHYRQQYPFLADRILVLPDAANDPGAPRAPRTNGPLTVTYVGSWYAGRGIELIVELARTLPEMRFVAAGGKAEDLAGQGLHCPTNLQCLGYLAPAEVASVLRDADVLVAPYQTKIEVAGGGGDTAAWSSPMKFFEYMAHGKAIISSDLPVFHEVFNHEQNCLFVPPADLNAWRAALQRLDADRNLAVALGQAARAQFLQRHTWAHRTQQLLASLGTAADSPKE